ncbi:MAG: hypothetical protein WC866_04860 [Patescibacteria group bacterium]
MVEMETPDPSDLKPKACASCKGVKKVSTTEGQRPCIACTPGQNCPYCGAKFVVSGPCGMCGHIVTLKEYGF